MFSTPPRRPTIERIAAAMGTTVLAVTTTGCFEQTIYDMARSIASDLPALRFQGASSQSIVFDGDKKRINFHYEDTSGISFVPRLAEVYRRFFPETNPGCSIGYPQTISFLAEAFLIKVLPVITFWRDKPHCLHHPIHFVDCANKLLTSPLDPGLGHAVYLTGDDNSLGRWVTAHRLSYNTDRHRWEITLPSGLRGSEFKFLTGPYREEKIADTSQLHYEPGDNRILILHESFADNRSPEHRNPPPRLSP